MSESLAEQVARLPASPGVYLFRDSAGKVLYVGKARDLRARVRQYLAGHDERPMVRFLLAAARAVDFVVVPTEKDALLLENTLIKKHRPRYNVKLVDDASFLHLQVDLAADWPRWRLVRRIRPARAGERLRHFGPFASASRARATLDFLNRRFPLRTCSDRELNSRDRPCLLAQMGRCLAPCVGACTREDYDAVLHESILFLEGRRRELVDRLRRRMAEAAEAEAFEEAARLRDLVAAIEASIERQHVVDTRLGSRDAWGLHRDGPKGAVAVAPVREGQLQEVLVRHFARAADPDPALLRDLLLDWYAEAAVPPEVLLPFEPDDAEVLAELLGSRRGGSVRLRVPRRGAGRSLLDLAGDNARAAFERRARAADRSQRALVELQRACRLPTLPRRIECFDNSNIQGSDPVAAMVVFVDGRPERARYRRYRVKTVEGADDFATMREILGRRLRRALAEADLPDLLVVDGGKGQLNAALAVMAELGIRDQRHPSWTGPRVSVIGLAKPRAERARGDREALDKVVLPGVRDPVRLPAGSEALRLLQAVRDASHREAVGYHRKVRRKRTLGSALDGIPGVGPARRQALLRHFGSLRALRAATAEQIAEVPGIGPATAARIAAALREAAGS